MSEPGAIRYCTECGKPAAGRFCGYCGHALAVNGAERLFDDDGWTGILKTVAKPTPGNSVASVTWRLLRNPSQALRALVEDRTYRMEWAFLAAMIGANFTLFSVLIPRALMHFGLGSYGPVSHWVLVQQQILIVASIAILAPVFYYAGRLLSKVPITPRAFLKLTVLSFGYWYSLYILIQLAAVLLAIALAFAFKAVGWTAALPAMTPVFGVAVFLIMEASVFWVVALLCRRFWRMGWIATIVMGLGYILLSQRVVFPIISRIEDALHLSDWMQTLTG